FLSATKVPTPTTVFINPSFSKSLYALFVVITLILRSLAKLLILGRLSPGRSFSVIIISLICSVICIYIGLSAELLIIIFILSSPSKLSVYIQYIYTKHICQYFFNFEDIYKIIYYIQ